MKLEEKLVSLRKAKGLSQLKLAEMMNVSRQAVSRWEVGAAVPSTENLKYLGRLYDVPLEFLLHDDAPNPIQKKEDNKEVIPQTDGKKRMLVIVAVAVILVFICAVLGRKAPQEVVSMDSMEGSEVETNHKNSFDIEF